METYRGLNHARYVFAEERTDQTTGEIVREERSYTELSSGMHYFSPQLKAWLPASPSFEIRPDGTVESAGVCFQARISPDARGAASVSYTSPNGESFRSRLVGLALYDAMTGESVMIATARSAAGELDQDSRRKVIFKNCFDGVEADLVYDLSASEFAQDVVLRQKVNPADYGLDVDHCRLEIWTEFDADRGPTVEAASWGGIQDTEIRARMHEPDWIDDTLVFGDSVIGAGTAFPVQAEANAKSKKLSAVAKRWLNQKDRSFLIEAVPAGEALQHSESLPTRPPAENVKADGSRATQGAALPRRAIRARPFPGRVPAAPVAGRSIELAAMGSREPGYLIDFTVLVSVSGQTFKGDETYYVSSPVTLTGITTIEGGTCVKYGTAADAKITVTSGTVNCLTSAYLPATFTSVNDDSVGEILTHQPTAMSPPSNGSYGFPALALNIGSTTLSNLRFFFAGTALSYGQGTTGHSLKHVQIGRCGTAVEASGMYSANIIGLKNALIYNCLTGFAGIYVTATVENATLASVYSLQNIASGSISSSISLYNCLMVGVSSDGSTANVTRTTCADIANAQGVFAPPLNTAAAAYYLADPSPYRNVGNTAVGIWGELKSLTTYPPRLVTAPYSVSTVLTTTAPRDSEMPDLGYHYPPLDYVMSAIDVNNCTVTLADGAALAAYGNSALRLKSGAKIVGKGSPIIPVVITRYQNVMERSSSTEATWTPEAATMSLFEVPVGGVPAVRPEVSLRFVDLPILAGISSRRNILVNNGYALPKFDLRDCELANANISVSLLNDSATFSASWNNNLLERCQVGFFNNVATQPVVFKSFNNLYRNCLLTWNNSAANSAAGLWDIRDNMFHWDSPVPTSTIVQTGNISNSKNSYIPSTVAHLVPASANNVDFTTFTFVSGSLGRYYQNSATTPTLIDSGSRSASVAGLFHHTVLTSGSREGGGNVDIGYHYVATSGGQPLDSDGDGLADYLEDQNGDGLLSSGETSIFNPVISLNPSANTFTEQSAPVSVDSTASLSDLDSPDFNGGLLTVSLVAGASPGDRLWVQSGGQLSVNATGDLTYSATVIGKASGGTMLDPLQVRFTSTSATPAVVQAVLRAVSFQNREDDPVPTPRQIQVLASDGDGGISAPVSRMMNIAVANDPPKFTVNAADANYRPGSYPVLLIPEATIYDPDSPNFNGGQLTAEIKVGAGVDDRLELRHTGLGQDQVGIQPNSQTILFGGVAIGTYTTISAGSLLTVTFNSAATSKAVEAVARSIQFKKITTGADTTTRGIEFKVKDASTSNWVVVNKNVSFCVGPLKVALVLDNSDSMKIKTTGIRDRRIEAIEAAQKFIDQLSSSDSIAVICFAEFGTLNQALTTDKVVAKQKVSEISCPGYTAIFRGIETATAELLAGGNSGYTPVIIVLTDGGNSLPGMETSAADEATRSAANVAKEAGIRVITIGIGESNTALLSEIASNGAGPGGKEFYTSPDPTKLKQIYDQIAGSLCRNGNMAPIVNIGADRFATLINGSATITLSPSNPVDDNLPVGGTLSYTWYNDLRPTDSTAPATVIFSSPFTLTTSATFTSPGTYQLRLAVSDGSLIGDDTMIVEVFAGGQNNAPRVSAGPPQWVTPNQTITLPGRILDDGVPSTPAPSALWTVASGGGMPFVNGAQMQATSTAVTPQVKFSSPGKWTLQLKGTDGAANFATDQVTVVVCDSPPGPVDMVLAVDVSGSSAPYIDDLQKAVRLLLDRLDLGIHQVSVIAFSSTAAEVTPLTRSRQEILARVDSLKSQQSTTDIAAAIRVAHAELRSNRHNGTATPIIVLLSDGDTDDVPAAIEAAKSAKMDGIWITAVGFDPGGSGPNASLLQPVASSDNDYHPATIADPVDRILANIAASFCAGRNNRPVVDAGPDRANRGQGSVQLEARVLDEGTPLYSWQLVSGPGTATFLPQANVINPTVSFSAAGDYVLRLTATDSSMQSEYDDVTIRNGSGTAPVATADLFTIPAPTSDKTSPSYVLDILGNDRDGEGDPFVLVRSGTGAYLNPTKGALEIINAGRAVRYTPTPGTIGLQDKFTYQITDGRDGTSEEVEVTVQFIPANLPPLANPDYFVVNPSASPVALQVMRNDGDPDPGVNSRRYGGAGLKIIAFSQPVGGTGSVSGAAVAGGFDELFYNAPTTTFNGTATFSYTVVDNLGMRSSATVIVRVVPGGIDPSPPTATIEIGADRNSQSRYPEANFEIFNPTVTNANGEDYTFNWEVVSQPAAAEPPEPLFYDGPGAVYQFRGDGVYTLRCQIIKTATQAVVASDTVNVSIADQGIRAQISNVNDDTRVDEGLFEVRGVAFAPNFQNYSIRVYPRDPVTQTASGVPVITTGLRTVPVSVPSDPDLDFGVLETLDFTQLQNGKYYIDLTVTAANSGSSTTRQIPFVLDSPLKLGQVRFLESDSLIPFNGVPFAIQRSYDSYNPGSGDFGPGWNWALTDLNVQLYESREARNSDDGEVFSMRTGGSRDITLDLPGGRRTTFQFSKTYAGIGRYRAEWIAPPGVTATLRPTVSDILVELPCVFEPCMDPYWQAAGPATPMNSYDFPGFILKLADGTEFLIGRDPIGSNFVLSTDEENGSYITAYGAPRLKSITTPDGHRLEISDDRIDYFPKDSATPAHGIEFQRYSATGRVSGIVDAVGLKNGDSIPVVKYDYTPSNLDPNGRLWKVHKLVNRDNPLAPVYETTTYGYTQVNGRFQINSVTDPRGVPVGLVYYYSTGSNSGRVWKVEDARGRVLETQYDLSGKTVTTIDQWLQTSTEKTFDKRGNIVAAKNALSQISYSTFSDQNMLLEHIDPLPSHRTTEYTYDLAGNLTSVTRPERINNANAIETSNYNKFGEVVSRTDARGATSTTDYDTAGRPTLERDARNFLTTYEYNGLAGRLSKVIDPLQHQRLISYDSAGNCQSETVQQYTGSGYTTLQNSTYSYDANGNVLTKATTQNLRNGVTRTLTTKYKYDSQNRIVETQNPDGGIEATIYNTLGKATSRQDPLGWVTTYLYDKMGDLAKTTFANGDIVRGLEDKIAIAGSLYRFRLVEDAHQVGATTITGTMTIFDALGRVWITQRVKDVNITESLNTDVMTLTLVSYVALDTPGSGEGNSQVIRTYDENGRLHQETDARGSSTTYEYSDEPPWRQSTRSWMDVDGINHSQVRAERLDFNGNVIDSYTSYDGVDGPSTIYQYNELNQRTHVLLPPAPPDVTGVTTLLSSYDARGRVVSTTDGGGVVTLFSYDALDRIASVTKASGLADQTVTKYTYDLGGNQIRITDALNRVTYFDYDEMGRLTGRVLPGGKFATFAYDKAGNRAWAVDFKGKRTTYQYDNRNRLTSITPDASTGDAGVMFTYYPFGNRYTMSDATGLTTWTYDSRKRLQSKATPQGTLSYSYNDNSQVQSVASSNNRGSQIGYTYDEIGRLAVVTETHDGVSYPTVHRYDGLGRLTEVDSRNSVNTSTYLKHVFTYNNRGQMRGVELRNNSATLASFNYTLGPAGQRYSLTADFPGVGGRTSTYSYDPLYRLEREIVTGVVGNVGTVTYDGSDGYSDPTGFDAVGNRRSRTSTIAGVAGVAGVTYDSRDRISTQTFDDNGNTISAGGRTFTYDFRDFLKGATAPTVACTVDGEGNRTKGVVGGVATYYLVDDNNPTGYPQVLEEVSVAGAVPTVKYVWGTQLISQRRGNASGPGAVNYIGRDGLGSIRALVNTSGQISDAYQYDAFGILVGQHVRYNGTLVPVGAPGAPAATENNYLYAGERWDPSLGLYYLRARYYHPDSGRFWNMDSYSGSLSEPLSLHKYLYANGNPVNGIDPSGHFTINGEAPSAFIRENLGKLITVAVLGGGVLYTRHRFGDHSLRDLDKIPVADIVAEIAREPSRQAQLQKVVDNEGEMTWADAGLIVAGRMGVRHETGRAGQAIRDIWEDPRTKAGRTSAWNEFESRFTGAYLNRGQATFLELIRDVDLLDPEGRKVATEGVLKRHQAYKAWLEDYLKKRSW
ncbi:MAG: VWA domain-containing protein [Verrucomicrobiota bacterium]